MKLNWLRKDIQNFTPYKVAPITVDTVINANESAQNIWDLPTVKADLLTALMNTKPHTYPAPMADGVTKLLASYVNLPTDWIMVGNGGDELLNFIAQAFINPNDKALIHTPTFDIYELGVTGMGGKVIKIADDENYQHQFSTFLEEIKTQQPKIVYICNPNNPTGAMWSKKEIEEILATAPQIVVLDEAYIEFSSTSTSFVNELKNYPNLFILRTLSKAFGLAGARVGYILSQPENIQLLGKVKAPYNVNNFSQTISEVALKHQNTILQYVDTVKKERAILFKELSLLPNLKVYPSETNFLLITSPLYNEIYHALLANGILVKYYGAGSSVGAGLRITITTPAINNLVLKTITKVVNP